MVSGFVTEDAANRLELARIFESKLLASRTVRMVDRSGHSGSSAIVSLELVAQGDENGVGFSVNYDPTVLGNPQAAFGSGDSSATLITNSNQAAQGRYGVLLALPAGHTFAAGARQLVTIASTRELLAQQSWPDKKASAA